MRTSPAFPPSLWASVTPAGPKLEEVEGVMKADVLVIGAGFTGLSTALHLRRAGVDVAVVEAVEPGWGASGRNNGQVIPTLSRPDPDDVIRRHRAAGERFVRLVRDCASILFDTVREERIEAEAEQSGWIQPAHSPGRIKIAERRVKQWSKHGAPVELLSRDQVRTMIGSDAWYGGFWNRTGGHINPLALSRGLARSVLGRGGRIYARSPVLRFRRDGTGWIAETPKGSIKSRALVLATNAYTGEFSNELACPIAREVVPVFSWQMSTQPLSDNVRKTIIPGRQAVSDTHREIYSARYDARNRLVSGGVVLLPHNEHARIKQRVIKRLERIFPQIGPIKLDYQWNGYIGMTRDYFPRVHRLGPDGYAWVGCNGRGVGLAVALGRDLAKAVQGTPVDQLGLPLSEPDPVPLHAAVRRFAPRVMLAYYRYLDWREV